MSTMWQQNTIIYLQVRFRYKLKITKTTDQIREMTVKEASDYIKELNKQINGKTEIVSTKKLTGGAVYQVERK